MDYKKIEGLLDDYWNGVSTLEQEKELVTFFTKEKVPEHLLEYQPLFQFFREEKENVVSTSFDANLMLELEKEQEKEVDSVVKIKRIWHPLLRVAACIMLVSVLWVLYENSGLNTDNNYAMVDTYDTPEEAYKETMRALQLVSKKMDKGSKTAIGIVPSAGIITKVVKKKKRK